MLKAVLGLLLIWIVRILDHRPPARPAAPTARLVRKERGMPFYEVDLPPVVDADVATRELSASVNGGDAVITLVKPGDPAPVLEFHENDSVTLVLVDVDGAGNRSEPSPAYAFTADTIPPATPGSLSVKHVPDPTPPVTEPVDATPTDAGDATAPVDTGETPA